MKLVILDNWPALLELKTDWQALLLASGEHPIFLSWEWMDAWRQAVREEIPPKVLCVYKEQQLVGLLPLWLTTMKLGGLLQIRVLRFLGDTCNAFEYPAPLCHMEHKGHVLETLREGLAQITDWDLLWFPNCSDQGAVAETMAALAPQGAFYKDRPTDFSRFALPDTWDDYEVLIGRQQRQKNRRLMRKFRGLGGEFECCNEAGQIDEYFRRLMDLHNQRWHSVGKPGTFHERPAVVAFYERFLPLALDAGWLFMTGYRQDGVLKAVQLGLRFDETYMQIQEGFDTDMPAGLGNALRYYSMQQCLSQGLKVYDFLGGHTEHKRRWGGEQFDGLDCLIVSQRNPLLNLVFRRIWPTGRWVTDPSRAVLDEAAGL